ncbi:MAG: hypothetical protein WDO69_20670 [Pseudomonadota bacterium]
MSQITRFAALALALAGASSALGACQAIAGIEDRTLSPVEAGAGAGPDGGEPPSQQCQDYCTKSRAVCGDLLYRTDDACLATCALFPLEGKDKNSVACRVGQLEKAAATSEDLPVYCAKAGPGGDDACGSNCENYCSLFAAACPSDFESYALDAAEGDSTMDLCVSKCQGLVDTGLYDSRDTGNYLGDTLQCRIVHTTSATVDPDGHCEHATLKSSKCVDDPTAEPDCDTFCHLEMAECTEANGNPIYESVAQCKAVCQALDPGHLADQAENTVGCRMYHSYNSVVDPNTHCAHTGPGGDGHCGSTELPESGNTGNCESYCRLLEAACKDDFDGSFANQTACQKDCVQLDGAGPSVGYSTAASGDNVQCRLLNVSRALSNPTKYCGAAQGDAPCK